MIYLKNLTKKYGGFTALDNVSLHIPKGSVYGVIGASGAGKSTLIRCINLLEMPDRGSVVVDGVEMTTLAAHDLRAARHNIGMIFQHFNLLNSRTVYGNISLPLELKGLSRTDIKNTITPLIELTGLNGKAHQYPSQLSGGQKQRVAIARALASQPEVLLCDEATSALDPNTTKNILALLDDINKRLGITIVLITHEMNVARMICDNVAVMSNGRIVENNHVEQIFLNPQEDITQQFVRSVTHEKSPTGSEDIFSKDPFPGGLPVIRLVFIGHQAMSPIITRTAREFDIDFSILCGDIQTVNNKSMGFLQVKLIGPEEKIAHALHFLRQQELTLEVDGYAR